MPITKSKYDLLKKCQDEIINGLAAFLKQNMTDFINKTASNYKTIPLDIETKKFEYIEPLAKLSTKKKL